MKKLNIALLAGGNSSEREVALGSAGQVYDALDRSKYDVWLIDVHGRNWTWRADDGTTAEVDKTDFSLTAAGRRIEFDYALIMIHGTPGENGLLQGYLEMMGIPFSTSDCQSSVETFDKTLCKRLVSRIDGLCLAREILLHKGEEVDPEAIAATLGLPVFVKPNASGSSCGVTKVKFVEEIAPAVDRAFTESADVLIEEFIEGREFGCGVLITAAGAEPLPVTEIVSHKEFFDYEAKYTAGMSEEITPADIPDHLASRLRRMAAEVAAACHCRGLVRADFLVRPDGRIYMIEINSIPGMSAGSIVPKQLRAAGMTMTEVLDMIIADTLCRR